MSRSPIPNGELIEILANSNPGLFAFGLNVSPLLQPLGFIEMVTTSSVENERLPIEESPLQKRSKKFACAQHLLQDFFSQSSFQDVSEEQKKALLNFSQDFDSAKRALLVIIEAQIACVKTIINKSAITLDGKQPCVFTREEKSILNVLVDNVKEERLQNVNALQKEDNPKIFARATIATIGTLRYCVEASRGIEGDEFSREDQLKTLCVILGVMMGAIGALAGPVGLVAGILLGAAIGFYIGKALARATASPEERLKNQCVEYRKPSLSSIMDKHSLHAGQFGKGSMWQKPKRPTEAEIARQGAEHQATQFFVPPVF